MWVAAATVVHFKWHLKKKKKKADLEAGGMLFLTL